MWKQAVTKDLIYKSIPPISPFPSIHNIELGEKSIQISFKHRADAHSFVNVIKVISKLLKLQMKEEKDEIDCFHGIEFWPHDPKVSSVINNFSEKPLTPRPKFDRILNFDRNLIELIENTKDETVKADNQNDINLPESTTTIKTICSDIPTRNQHSDYAINSKNQFNQDTSRKKMTKKKQKQKIDKTEISIPIGMQHVAGVTKGVSLIENCDIEHAIKELLKVAGLNENLLSDPDIRNKLESVCQENNFVTTFQNYRVISNCFDGSVKIKRRKSDANESDEVDSTLISTEIPGSNVKDNSGKNVASQDKKESYFQEHVSDSPLHIYPDEPLLEEFVIKDTIPSTSDPSKSVTTNISAVFSCPVSPEEPLVSLDRADNNNEDEPSCNGEEKSSSGSFQRSLLEVELRPIPSEAMKTSHHKGQLNDIDVALDNAIQLMRPFIRMSICDDNECEDYWSS